MDLRNNLGNLPLSLEPNMGQADRNFSFLARCSTYTLLSKPSEMMIISNQSERTLNDSCLTFKLLGGKQQARTKFLKKLTGKANYLIGNEPEKWLKNIPTYSKVRYSEVYPLIDMDFYGLQNQLEYDFIIRPGGNPKRINTQIQGATSLALTPNGDLSIQTDNHSFVLKKPVAYQLTKGRRTTIRCRYRIKDDNRIGFELGRYNKKQNLIIDPVLIFSTYLGGSSSDNGTDVAVDNNGDIYVTGFTSSTNFPTEEPLQANLGGFTSAFITKIDSEGNDILYSTYLGGNNTTIATAIDVDRFGNAYVTGTTSSTNFPTSNPLQSSFRGASDAFVAKVNEDGSDLVYSTYLGGRGLDTGTDIAVDQRGNAYVGGFTNSDNFPVRNALQQEIAGSLDGFIAKISPSGSLVYSTYLGGSGADTINGISIDRKGNAYVTGSTTSEDFPVARPIQEDLQGNRNAFVTKINAAGSALIYSTYLGGSGFDGDQGNDIAVDDLGNAYIVGQTDSPDFPVVNALQADLLGDSDAFIAKLTATGSELIYSTYLGGDSVDFGNAITVDDFGNAYITGVTQSSNFPTVDPLQSQLAGPSDAFVAQIDQTGASLLFSTYLGGDGDEEGSGIALDPECNLIVVGTTTSEDFPVENPLQANFGGFSDAFITKVFLESACEE